MRTEQPPFLYQVFDPDGKSVMRTEYPSCRYPAHTELSILDAGLTIKINGKKLTKKEVQSRS